MIKIFTPPRIFKLGVLCLLVLAFFNGCKKDNHVVSPTPVLSEDKDLQILSLLKDPSYMLSTITGMEGDDRFEKVLQEQERLQKELIAKYHLPTSTAEITISKAIDTYRMILQERGKKDEWRYEYLPKLSVKSLGNVKASGGWDGGTLPEVTVIGLNINTAQLERDYLRMVDELCVEVRTDAKREVRDFIMRVEDIVRSARSARNHQPTIDGLLSMYRMETFAMKQRFYGYEIMCNRLKIPDPGAPPRPPLGGGGFPVQPVTNKDIIDSLQGYPCAQNLVRQLPNLKNDIAELLKNVFDKNDKMNLVFKVEKKLTESSEDGFFDPSKIIVNNGATTYPIWLNPFVLENSSKEYILVTMYHEALHAFLLHQKVELGDVAFNKKYPEFDSETFKASKVINGHSSIAANFSTRLADVILSFNPNFSRENALALAKGGVFELNRLEMSININERNTNLGLSKGTKCN